MNKRILIIEDNEQNMYLLTFLLEKSGFEIIQARNGRDGIDNAARLQPELILLDIQLPIMDGYAVAKELKANESTRSIPIVAVTSYAMSGDRANILAAGCEGYIEKPINPDTFVDQITQFI